MGAQLLGAWTCVQCVRPHPKALGVINNIDVGNRDLESKNFRVLAGEVCGGRGTPGGLGPKDCGKGTQARREENVVLPPKGLYESLPHVSSCGFAPSQRYLSGKWECGCGGGG